MPKIAQGELAPHGAPEPDDANPETAKRANETGATVQGGYYAPAAKLPAMMFYPGDWRKDPALSMCSWAARGVWIELLCLLWESPRRGYLILPSGQSPSPAQVARMLGGSEDEITPLLAELEAAGVFSRDENGVIFSRRMDRDEYIRRVRSEAGKKGAVYGHRGGRPRKDEQGEKPQKRQNNPPSYSSSVAVSNSKDISSAGLPAADTEGCEEENDLPHEKWTRS